MSHIVIRAPLDEMQEEWRPSPEANGYDASNFGRVRVTATGILCRLTWTADLYQSVSVKIDGKWSSRQVGAMVCAAWHGPRPKGCHADHINAIRNDNRPENLRWLDGKINRAIVRHARGEQRHGARLTQAQVDEIRLTYKPHARDGRSGNAMAKRFGVSSATVHAILHQKRWNFAREQQVQELRESL